MGEAFEDAGTKAQANFQQAVIYYDRGELELSRKNIEGWRDNIIKIAPNYLRPFQQFGYSYVLGLIDLKEGNAELAKARLEEIKIAIPNLPGGATQWGKSGSTLVQAEIILSEGSCEEAIALLEEAPPL